MASTYTDILRLELPTTGELDATWGTRVNVGITALIETALAGTAAVTHSNAADYTLTTASGSADEARAMFLNVGGALTAARNVVCPTKSKLYYIRNATTGGFAITLKTTAGTGISVPNGAYLALYCDGTNVVDAATHMSALTLATDLAVADGGTGRSTSTTAYALLAAGTTATGAHQTLAAGATTEVLVGGGTGALPVWTAATGTGSPVRGTTPTIATPVINGLPTGTGVATANTVSTLVARDASGNFAAGTITASLTGTASGSQPLDAARSQHDA